MERTYYEDRLFENMDGSGHPAGPADYEGCRFTRGDWNEFDFRGSSLTECEFTDCNLSMIKLEKTSLNDVRFIRCKIFGAPFYLCNEHLFTVRFEDCLLNFSSFHQRKMKKTVFKRCDLTEVDFSGADLQQAEFHHCRLPKAVFENCNLEAADFRTASEFSIDPSINRMKGSKFTLAGLPGLLDRYGIHIE